MAETGQPYAFTGDDPLNATDPLGLSSNSKLNAIDRALRERGVYFKGGKRGGNFPDEAEPDQILYRVNKDGITSYQVYNSDGDPVKRVDLQGESHGGVETPHVVEYESHTNADGETFIKPSSQVRAATPSEIPTQAVEQPIIDFETPATGILGDFEHSIETWFDNGGLGDSGDDG